MNDSLIDRIDECRDCGRIAIGAIAVIVLGAVAYGFTFGIWRSLEQALYSALKMPVLMFAVTVTSGMLNAMLAQVLGSKLLTRQVIICILLSFAMTSAIMGAVSPIVLFFLQYVPSTASRGAVPIYYLLLFFHTAVVGFSGFIGNLKLYQLLRELTGSPGTSLRVLVSWILVSGLAGCQLSWIISPFLARPDIPVPVLNPDAFSGNFFEYLIKAFMELL